MQLIRVAAGVLNQTPLDWDRNLGNIIAAIEQAREMEADVLCLPELCITGYGCEDAFHSSGVMATAQDVLVEIKSHTEDLIVSVGLPFNYAGGIFNTACLLCDKRIVGLVGKRNLAGDGIHYEPRWFRRWPEGIQVQVQIEGAGYPLGDILFDCGGVKIGFEICEDAWVGTRPGSSLASRGADMILNPSASHFAFGKHKVRRRFVLEGSRAFHVAYVYSNLVGNESGRAIYDGDAMIASGGAMLATGPRFSYQPVGLTAATIDIAKNRMTRSRTGSFEPDVDGDETDVIRTSFTFREVEPHRGEVVAAGWEASADIKFEEFTRSVSLGLFDYMVKSHSRGVVVSLSGGVDSAAVAVLSKVMLQLAGFSLGEQELARRMAYTGAAEVDHDGLARQLITCVYQSTANSSQRTREAAAQLAAGLGARYLEFDVEDQVQEYVAMVSRAIGRELTWETDDLALQNIQARARSPGVWMLANIGNALLLSTSNRSEAAVGYATMDGDTSGGLAPIAGIDKAFLGRWLKWMEVTGPVGLTPIPELRFVTELPPTAELRPPDSEQTDEGDLMPYDRLDEIERLAIRDKRMPSEVFRELRNAWPEVTPRQLGEWIETFFRLWCRNQWKRERYAPSFHLDDENLDPKTWCRYPILSGGSRRELKQMWDYISTLTVSK